MGVAIKIENLSKQYRLGQIGTGTISHDLNRWWARIRGKEDPTFKLGIENELASSEGGYTWALQDIEFEVPQGEVVGIIGKNGAGKSTLLKILSRVTGPTTGSVKAKGRIGSLLEVGTGFHPELTGRENIFLNGAILGMNKAELRSKMEEIVEFSGISKYIDTPVKRYSSGMYVRLAFAVAAHLKPEILIIDEVLAVGDLSFQKQCIEKMKAVAGEGRTVLLVSHNMGMIKQLTKTCILLHQGKLQEYGDTDKVIEAYMSQREKYSAEYVQPHESTKPINLRALRLVDSEGKINSDFSFDQSFFINIEFEVNQPVEDCVLWVTISTPDGNIAFVSCDYDDNEDTLSKRALGYYTHRIEVPPRLLNVGSYFVYLFIMKNSDNFYHERMVKDVVSFTILNTNYPDLIVGVQRRQGVIRPVLNWESTFKPS